MNYKTTINNHYLYATLMIIQLPTSRCQQVGGIHGAVRLAGTDQQVRLLRGKRDAVCVPVGSIGLLQVSPRGMGNTEYNNHRFSPTWLWHLCGGIWLPCRFSDAMKLWVQALIAAKCKSDLLYRENTRAFQKVCLTKIPACLARKRNS